MFTPPKMSSNHDDFQASTLVDPGDFVKIKVWVGHSTDGSPSLGQGQASGRVDVPVGATKLATFFSFLEATPLHRSPQSVVLVNGGSRVEKMEKTVLVKRVEGRTKVCRVVDLTQIWGNLDEGIDIWAAVNGKSVNMHDTMAGIGINDQDTTQCYGKLRDGAQRFRQPPQDIAGQWTCSLCGQESVWPTKARLSVRKPRNHKISGQHASPAASTQQFPTLPSRHKLRVLEPMKLSRLIQVCVSTW